jgi:hypothetical protein
MDDERVLRVLEEIRDPQRQHLANYQDAAAISRSRSGCNRWV